MIYEVLVGWGQTPEESQALVPVLKKLEGIGFSFAGIQYSRSGETPITNILNNYSNVDYRHIKALLDFGVDVNARGSSDRMPPICSALLFHAHKPEVVRVLLDYGADTSLKIEDGPFDGMSARGLIERLKNGIEQGFYFNDEEKLKFMETCAICDSYQQKMGLFLKKMEQSGNHSNSFGVSGRGRKAFF